MNRNEKEEVVAGLSKKLANAEAVFVTDFQGLTVQKISGLREKIHEAGGDYQVAKNTLIRLAAKGTPLEQVNDMFVGNNALGTTDSDPVGLAKVLVGFAKENDKFDLKGGILSGKTMSFDQIKSLADMPSREELLAKLLGTMNAVPSGFVRVLAAVPQNFLYALSAIKDQKEAQT